MGESKIKEITIEPSLKKSNNNTLTSKDVLININNTNKVNSTKQKYYTSEYPYKGYKIIKITSFEQSQEYSKYCDWDVTYSNYLYNQYTDNGKNCFYYCLRYDYKDTNEPLSMLAVLVDDRGSLKEVTTRENNGDHYYKTEKEVEEHFDINNFSSVFNPITEEELKQAQEERQRIKEDYQKNIKQYLKEGHDIFVVLKNVYDYFYYENNLDLFKVENENKYNYIDREGNLLFNEWYDYLEYDKELDLFRVKNNENQNYINKNGNLLSNEWYDWFSYNHWLKLFEIENNDKENYIDREGNLLFNEWYDYSYYNEDLDLFKVKANNKYNYIDIKGNLLSNEWFDETWYHEEIELFFVEKNNKQNYINKQGNLLFNEWYDYIIYEPKLKLFYVENHTLNSNYYIDINGEKVEK